VTLSSGDGGSPILEYIGMKVLVGVTYRRRF